MKHTAIITANIYPHLTDDESVYELDEFDYMLENNDNIPEFND